MTLAFVGVVVMAAADVGIVAELTEKQRVHRCIRISADAAVKLYARLCKRRLSAPPPMPPQIRASTPLSVKKPARAP